MIPPVAADRSRVGSSCNRDGKATLAQDMARVEPADRGQPMQPRRPGDGLESLPEGEAVKPPAGPAHEASGLTHSGIADPDEPGRLVVEVRVVDSTGPGSSRVSR